MAPRDIVPLAQARQRLRYSIPMIMTLKNSDFRSRADSLLSRQSDSPPHSQTSLRSERWSQSSCCQECMFSHKSKNVERRHSFVVTSSGLALFPQRLKYLQIRGGIGPMRCLGISGRRRSSRRRSLLPMEDMVLILGCKQFAPDRALSGVANRLLRDRPRRVSAVIDHRDVVVERIRVGSMSDGSAP